MSWNKIMTAIQPGLQSYQNLFSRSQGSAEQAREQRIAQDVQESDSKVESREFNPDKVASKETFKTEEVAKTSQSDFATQRNNIDNVDADTSAPRGSFIDISV
jgi:hypothetical protein